MALFSTQTLETDILTNFTPYLWCGQNTHNHSEPNVARPVGGISIVASPSTGLNNNKSSVCVYIYTCVWNHALMPSQCSIVLWTTTVIYVKILSFPSSHRGFCCFLFSFCRVDSSHLTSSPCPVLSDCVVLLLPLSLIHASLALSGPLPAFLPALLYHIDLHVFLLHFAVPSGSWLSPFCTMHSFDSLILGLVSCPLSLGWHHKL